MKKSSSPTLEDVAREAGVSTATISRSINEPNKVAAPTLDRIQAVIQKLGYTPNFGGKVLASNRSNTVGAVIPTMANAMFASGLQAFQEVLSQSGIRLLVASYGYDSKDELNQIRSLVAHGADGLLLIGSCRPEETQRFLAVRNIPYVISWCYKPSTNNIYSGFDNEKAAAAMTRRVLNLGHRRIAMIAGLTQGNDRASNRAAGVKAAIRKFGDGAHLCGVVEAKYTLQDGGELLSRSCLATLRPRPLSAATTCWPPAPLSEPGIYPLAYLGKSPSRGLTISAWRRWRPRH